MIDVVIRVLFIEQTFVKIMKFPAVPHTGDYVWVGNGNWEIKSTSFRDNEMPQCKISFNRDNEGAYWTKEDFWLENGFVEH